MFVFLELLRKGKSSLQSKILFQLNSKILKRRGNYCKTLFRIKYKLKTSPVTESHSQNRTKKI